MECYCCLRNVQDLLADGKTPNESRFGEPFKGPIILFGALVEYHLISVKNWNKRSSMWQEGITRNLSWLWADRVGNLERWYFESRRGRLGKVGCIRYLSSENQCKGSIDQSKRWWSRLPIHRWNSKIVRERLRIPSTHSRQNPQMTLKPMPICGRSKVISSIVITVNVEFNSSCRRKKHSLFHWNTLML